MKINVINPIQYNKISFGKHQHTKQNVNAEGYETKAPVNTDTAKAYANYGISDNKDKDDIIPVNNLTLKIEGNDGFNTALVSIITTHKELIEAKKGLADIRQAILYGYANSFSKLGFPSAPLTSGDGDSFIGVECSPKNIIAAFYIAKFLGSKAAFVDEDFFEGVKNDLKSYYKENWNNMKNAKKDDSFMYHELIDEKSIDNVCKSLDNLSYNDYLKYCEDILKIQNNEVIIDLPQKMLDEKQPNIKEIEKLVLKNYSITNDYKFEVTENYSREI